MNPKNIRKGFTDAEKKVLFGLSAKIAEKHGCSSMYVRHIIHGNRDTISPLARNIVKDLKAVLILLRQKK